MSAAGIFKQTASFAKLIAAKCSAPPSKLLQAHTQLFGRAIDVPERAGENELFSFIIEVHICVTKHHQALDIQKFLNAQILVPLTQGQLEDETNAGSSIVKTSKMVYSKQ